MAQNITRGVEELLVDIEGGFGARVKAGGPVEQLS